MCVRAYPRLFVSIMIASYSPFSFQSTTILILYLQHSQQIIVVSTVRMVATQLSRRKGGGSVLKKLWEADLSTLSFPVFRGGGGGPSLVFWTKHVESNIDGMIYYCMLCYILSFFIGFIRSFSFACYLFYSCSISLHFITFLASCIIVCCHTHY